MDNMADVVRDDGKALELKQEKEYIKICIDEDEKAKLNEINNKNRNRAKHQKLNDVLNEQIRAKRLREENDMRANKAYMHQMKEKGAIEDK